MSFFLKDVENGGEGEEAKAAGGVAAAEGHEGQAENADSLNEALSEGETEFVSAQKKPMNQTAMMLFFIAVVGAAGTYFMYVRNGPAVAKASDPVQVKAEAAITDFMKAGHQNVSLLRALLDGTAKIVEQFKAYPNMTQIPLSDLKANPFHFANYKAAPEADPEELAKKKREAERLAVLKSVQTLQLQSVVIRGSRKACMINNTLYQEGEVAEGFTVEKISNNAVIVKQAAYRFELRMAK